ncbi:hypothetical protein [Alkalibacillus salilacus]|uniref:CopG family antitoxin n=1 Tax=Alkalibacillus salilacus TaxID=284582 RepID=A0ABT9VIG6_9BACI|nr:hypothetical protein [Alkalibacillus salilacus]MDQ0160747.1 putative CopG family antitoxin [Alkalibacillus salilacus]
MTNKYPKATISFPPRDSDVWEHLQSIKAEHNVSDYIRSLIRQDMEGQGCMDEQKIINQVLQALQVNQQAESQSDVERTLVHDETKHTIDNLF